MFKFDWKVIRSRACLLDLQEHCEMLSLTLSELWRHDPVTYVKDGETLEFNDAAEWLDLASAVSVWAGP